MDGGRWIARGGWSIEAIVLDTTPCFRVSRHRYLIKYCATLAELTLLLEMNGLDLGDLVEDDPECELARGRGHAGDDAHSLLTFTSGPVSANRFHVASSMRSPEMVTPLR